MIMQQLRYNMTEFTFVMGPLVELAVRLVQEDPLEIEVPGLLVTKPDMDCP